MSPMPRSFLNELEYKIDLVFHGDDMSGQGNFFDWFFDDEPHILQHLAETFPKATLVHAPNGIIAGGMFIPR
jgi:hypothetical protein